MLDQHLLVLGAGSIGKRHLRNFARLGCQVSAMDPRSERLEEAKGEVPLVYSFTNLNDALKKSDEFTAVVVGSPTKYHVDQTIAALEVDLPVFLEKPLCKDETSAIQLVEAVKKSTKPVMLGYTYRWWPPVRDLKAKLDEGVLGKVLHVQCTMSAHLADWHPWEPYQEFFMSSLDLGGGALLDESHFLDLMLWMFGMPREVYARIERLSNLEIETDDFVNALLGYDNGLRIFIHLDLFGRPHTRSITVRGEGATLQWVNDPERIRFNSEMSQAEWQDIHFSCERNHMFMQAAREFLEVLENNKTPSCTVEDGYAVMRVIEAMRRSSHSGKTIILE